MKYSNEEVLQYVNEEDVKFIRLAFCDVFGKQKNISIMPGELERAFRDGISFDASAIAGFGGNVHSDLLLRPDPSTLSLLPWRPEHGRVVRMFCAVTYPDGRPFEADSRTALINAVEEAKHRGISFYFGPETEFYLFKRDEDGNPTTVPYDDAGYMDIAPEDKGENVRREICLTLERMGITPESSHHEEGPGQNEIDFRYSDPLTAADNAVTFRAVVNTVAARNGLSASFDAKPLEGRPGNGMHINFSCTSDDGRELLMSSIAGILRRAAEITAFTNPTESSYSRFGKLKAPEYISWSHENRSQLIRIPAATGEYRRAEYRSPDPTCNPYIVFNLLIRAALEGIDEGLMPAPAADINLYEAPDEVTSGFSRLPQSLTDARMTAARSDFVKRSLPNMIISRYTE